MADQTPPSGGSGQPEVYVEAKEMKIGTGGTARIQKSETFYQLMGTEEDVVVLSLLIKDTPSKIIEKVPLDEFEKRFARVENYFKEKAKEINVNLSRHLSVGEQHLEKQEYYSAEFEFDSALKMDQRNLRANLGKSQTRAALGDEQGAVEILKKMSDFDDLYQIENKHVFNKYGIQLRNHKMYDDSVQSYVKALKCDSGDEHLFYNLARALYEKGDQEKACRVLKNAIRLNPDFKDGETLLAYYEKHPPQT
ncbi:MAG: tetratricopeptide repeat protein [Deltaproteobacteria bacterium]|nr:tetratricopeptide repeat protein [Deltaproteobacteria bacterium]